MSQDFDPKNLPLIPLRPGTARSLGAERVLRQEAANLLHSVVDSIHDADTFVGPGFRHFPQGSRMQSGAEWFGREFQLRADGPTYIFKGVIGFSHKTVAFSIEEPNAFGMQSAERVLKFGANPAEVEANLHLAKSPVFVGPPGEQRPFLPPMTDYAYFRNMPFMVFEKVDGKSFGPLIKEQAKGMPALSHLPSVLLQAFDGIQALLQRGIGYVDRFSPNAFLHETDTGPLLTMIDLDLIHFVTGPPSKKEIGKTVLQSFCFDVAGFRQDIRWPDGMQPFFRQFRLALDSLDPTVNDDDLVSPSAEEVRAYLLAVKEIFSSTAQVSDAWLQLADLQLGKLPKSDQLKSDK